MSSHSTLGEGRAARALRLSGLLVIALAACGGTPSQPPQMPSAIAKGDVCAVCGMYIEGMPGPRGEAYVEGRRVPLKFGSTRDFFAYVLDPEHQRTLQQLFVQDAATIDWHNPSGLLSTFTDARLAWYVAWQPLPGEMGPTLASFARRTDAQAFVREHGGEMLQYGQVTTRLISLLGYSCPEKGDPAFALVTHCVKVRGGAE